VGTDGKKGKGSAVSFITHVRATLFSHGPCVGCPSRRREYSLHVRETQSCEPMRTERSRQLILDKSESSEAYSLCPQSEFQACCRMPIAVRETRPNMDWNWKTFTQTGPRP
jgi:hypothetical protein